jgi:DNA-binding protein
MCNTGAPGELAQRLHASKRQLYNVQNGLRALDARIDYSHSDYTFYSLIWTKIAIKVKFKAENEITLMF